MTSFPLTSSFLKYVPDLNIMDNNTAITIAAQGAYVYWDEYDSDLLNFKGYVFENDKAVGSFAQSRLYP